MRLSYCKIRYYLFCLFFVLFVVSSNAQGSRSISVEFTWNGTEKVEYHGDTISRISFDGAFYDGNFPNEPLLKKIIPIYSEDVDANFEINIKSSECVPFDEINLLPSNIDTIPCINYNIQTYRTDCNLCVTISPFFKRGNDYMRINSCEITYRLTEKKSKSEKEYLENSLLASGDWYKMAVSSTGMYKLTYSDFTSMGIPITSINPRNIRLFHNGGGVLPFVNKTVRNEDLVEIPVYVHGENDGVFNEGDYVIFYARGPVTWDYKNGSYERVLNPYSDYSYVFLTLDLGEGKRIQNAENITSESVVKVSSFADYQLKEEDLYNLNNMGASWYFDVYDAELSRSYVFNFPNLIKDKQCILSSEMASRNLTNTTQFQFKANGNFLTQVNFTKNTNHYVYAKIGNTGKTPFLSNKDEITIDLEYLKYGSSATAWLDYITITAWRDLKFVGNVMSFRNPECVDIDKVYRYEIKNASNAMQVWDVTNPVEPKKLQLQYSSNVAAFDVKGVNANEFIAFNGSGMNTPTFVSKVSNQNLHSKYDFDYLIVAHPDFYSQAQRLKNIHSEIDDLEIEIVTPQQIYNEFSCGAVDVTAIRDYIKMVYDKSDERLKYVLLFGDASYDFRNKSGNVCFVPSYESVHSTSSQCNVTDDFFACMDPNEGDMEASGNVVDIAVGRMPVGTLEDATNVVDKIVTYLSKDKETMGDWRKLITFITDDEVSFMTHAEQLEQLIKNDVGEAVNFDKIYLDSYPQIATSSGQRSPECNAAITNRVELGSLIIDYIGHAGEVGWADERILMNEDILSWKNSPKLHFMITASCEFSRFDDHTRTSAGEYVFLNSRGGAIAMISAARVTLGSNNQSMFKGFYEHLFDIEGGDYLTMGELYVYAKQIGDANSKDYAFFGDPALRLNYPKNSIEITSINDHDVNQIDTLKALQRGRVEGVVKDIYGKVMSDFNGILDMSIYDKENSYETYGDQQESFLYKLRNNVIYSGKVVVTNGEFTVDFILPKDINYSYGNGLMSLYAYSENADAQGCYSNFIVGGLNQDAEPDDEGPEIELFIDDVKFVDGSMTNENPLLLAYIKDKNGVNTSSAGIGHDITATLTGATNKTYTLNQFYDSPHNQDDYGVVSYKLYNLNEGEHLLTFRVWDIYNNSNTKTIRFNVVKGNIINIENVSNYPNPMHDNTNFVFEHNQKDNEIDIQIRIYDIMGQLVRTLSESRFGTSARIEPIVWDGTSDKGKELPSGMYVYYVTITNSHNEQTSEYSKLIIK